MGMSGAGKTFLGFNLQKHNWFHYCVDYRIGTHYLGEAINNDLKRMVFLSGEPLANLLRSDSISIAHNVSCRNLEPLSKFMGGLGLASEPNEADRNDPALYTDYFKGISHSLEQFVKRQNLHYQAEISATQDLVKFLSIARDIYKYPHFINDTSGSLCEIVAMTPDESGILKVDPDDPTFQLIERHTLPVYIEPSATYIQELIRRNREDPKPIYYRTEFLYQLIEEFLTLYGLDHPDQIYPASFSRFAFPRLIKERLPRYRALARACGITISLKDISALIRDPSSFKERFDALIEEALLSTENLLT